MSIQLTEKQMPYLGELMGYIKQIESVMAEPVSTSDLNSLSYQLAKACTLLALQGRIMELASALYDYAKGEAVKQVNKDLKLELLRLELASLLSVHSARFERAERVVKGLTTYIDGLRTLISAEKELSKNLQ